MCQTKNIEEQIAAVVKESDNTTWKINYSELLNERDALLRDLLYHKSCMTIEWQKLTTRRKQETTLEFDAEIPDIESDRKFIAAEEHFFSQLQDRTSSGEFIPASEAQNDYQQSSCIISHIQFLIM